MGFVRVSGLLGDRRRKQVREVNFLTDTGSFYPVIPLNVAKELGIRRLGWDVLMLANKKKVRVPISIAYFKILDREGLFQVALMDCPEPFLGVTLLEGLGLKVDPSTGEVSYSRPYGLAILKFIKEAE